MSQPCSTGISYTENLAEETGEGTNGAYKTEHFMKTNY